MAVAGEIRVVFSGQLPGGEIWSFGLTANSAGISAVNQATLDTFVGQVSSVFSGSNTFFTDWKTNNPASTTLRSITAYYYATTANRATLTSTVARNDAGTATGTIYPNQVSLVASLRSQMPGRRGRGRIFMSLLCFPLPQGQLNQTGCNTLATDMGVFLQNLYTVTGCRWVIASNADNAMRTITTVIVDSRPDIQRRRANRQAVSFRANQAVSQP